MIKSILLPILCVKDMIFQKYVDEETTQLIWLVSIDIDDLTKRRFCKDL